ncbi:MAG: class I SAM-dependent methyltransferase [Cognatishimia sp.]|nr:class I SAM-dependent methyltransferase [Cognatishimia sp.]
MKRKTPEGASFAEAAQGVQLFAPSAARNLAPIAAEIANIAPPKGNALEIASGTGQHIIAHAKAHPSIHWQPSEIDEERIASVNAYVRGCELSNIAPAMELDATAKGWGKNAGYDLILLSNLLHLISAQEVETVLNEAAIALTQGGRFMVYGPFMRGGVLTSEGDLNFHNSLQAQDPEIGYKDDLWIEKTAQAAELTLHRKTEMPANNLAFTFQKP